MVPVLEALVAEAGVEELPKQVLRQAKVRQETDDREGQDMLIIPPKLHAASIGVGAEMHISAGTEIHALGRTLWLKGRQTEKLANSIQIWRQK